MPVFINGKEFNPTPKRLRGSGGEADIYEVNPHTALKLFKGPKHPDYAGNPARQAAAEQKLNLYEKKLANFPKISTNKVVVPQSLAVDGKGKMVGYTMDFLQDTFLLGQLNQRSFRDAGVPNERVIRIFQDVHGTVRAIHGASIVIGDFNDLNVLVGNKNDSAYFIDADSWQFHPYLCVVFNENFVDPTICELNKKRTNDTEPYFYPIKPHSPDTDWFAFNTMLFNSLMFVRPYGGKLDDKTIAFGNRPLLGISVFDSRVKYPKAATPLKTLPDELLDHFEEVFSHKKRGEFPEKLLAGLRWTKCTNCGLLHARSTCPNCTTAPQQAVIPVVAHVNNVYMENVFHTDGRILYAVYQDELRMVYEDGAGLRSNYAVVSKVNITPFTRFRVSKDLLHIGQNNMINTCLGNVRDKFGNVNNNVVIDDYQNIPMFDANSRNRFWVVGGVLKRDDVFGEVKIGEVLENNTLFWVGETMGFGFYRAGAVTVGFVFDAEKIGIDDSVRLPNFRGQLIDSSCIFGKDIAWFTALMNDGSQRLIRTYAIGKDGKILAFHEAKEDDETAWQRVRGNCAIGKFFLAATDNGIVRVSIVNNSLVPDKVFHGTEQFVNSKTVLLAGPDGLYAVNRQDILKLTIGP